MVNHKIMPMFQSLYSGEVEVHTTSVEATGNMEATYFFTVN